MAPHGRLSNSYRYLSGKGRKTRAESEIDVGSIIRRRRYRPKLEVVFLEYLNYFIMIDAAGKTYSQNSEVLP